MLRVTNEFCPKCKKETLHVCLQDNITACNICRFSNQLDSYISPSFESTKSNRDIPKSDI